MHRWNRRLIAFVLLATLLGTLPLHARGLTAELMARLHGGDGLFGAAVAIDQDTVVIGELFADRGNGAAYIFVRDGERWVQQARLSGSDLNHFGHAVAVQGDTAVITEQGDAFGVAGSAHVFRRHGAEWRDEASSFHTTAPCRMDSAGL